MECSRIQTTEAGSVQRYAAIYLIFFSIINSCLQVIRHYVILGMHPPPVCILLAKTPQFQMYQTLQDGSTITGLAIWTHLHSINTSPVLLHLPLSMVGLHILWCYPSFTTQYPDTTEVWAKTLDGVYTPHSLRHRFYWTAINNMKDNIVWLHSLLMCSLSSHVIPCMSSILHISMLLGLATVSDAWYAWIQAHVCTLWNAFPVVVYVWMQQIMYMIRMFQDNAE